MNFKELGHCKYCWWWRKSYCYYHRNTTGETSYCPDYYNRKKGNKDGETLNEWLGKHPEISYE